MKNKIDKSRLLACIHYENRNELVREPVVGLIKWLRPKGLNACSYAEKGAELKNQTNCKKIGWYTKVLCAKEYPRGMQYLKIALKLGYPCRFII